MNIKYFEFNGLRYDMGTKLIVQLPDGTIKETTYLGYGWFENLTPDVTEFGVVEITHPKYYVETLKRN